ncbi:MAG: di-heme oxidoredictase family protein [Gammaproteobacteria bacterium]
MLGLITLAAGAGLFGVVAQDDAHPPQPWRSLSAEEQQAFDLGHAVFNTQWTPAGEPAGRRDGLGPLFNAPSCDACHNSRRRGRGPAEAGPAPIDLVMQLGRRQPDGRITRRHREVRHDPQHLGEQRHGARSARRDSLQGVDAGRCRMEARSVCAVRPTWLRCLRAARFRHRSC